MAASSEAIDRTSASTTEAGTAAEASARATSGAVERTFVPAALLARHEPSRRVEQLCQFAWLRDTTGLRAYLAAILATDHFIDEVDGEGLSAMSRLLLAGQLEAAAAWLYRTVPEEPWIMHKRMIDSYAFGAALCGLDGLVEQLIREGAWLPSVIKGAARGEHDALVHRLLIPYAWTLIDAIEGAALGGRAVLLHTLFDKCTRYHGYPTELEEEYWLNWTIQKIIQNAAFGGQTALVYQWLSKEGTSLASLNDAVRGAAHGGHEVLVCQLLLMGAYHRSAIDGARKWGHLAALQARLERCTYLKEACEQCAVTTPIALLQFILEHPCPHWETQLPRLLANERLQAFWDGKSSYWFQRHLQAATHTMTYYGFTPKEAAVWSVYGTTLLKLHTLVSASEKTIVSHFRTPVDRGCFLVLGNGNRVPMLGTHKNLLDFFGTRVSGLNTDEIKALFKKVNDKHLLNAANAAAKTALEVFLRKQRSASAGIINWIRSWGIPSKIRTLLKGVLSHEDLLARLEGAIATASGSYQRCLEKMRSAIEIRKTSGYPRRASGPIDQRVIAVASAVAGASYTCDATTYSETERPQHPDDAQSSAESAHITRPMTSTFFSPAAGPRASDATAADGGAPERKREKSVSSSTITHAACP